MSERHACRLVGLSRDSYRHTPVASAQTQALKTKIVEIAHARRRFGYRRVHELLRQDFPGVNHKRVYRIYREGVGAVNTHISDTGVDDLEIDGVILNEGPIEAFRYRVLDTVIP